MIPYLLQRKIRRASRPLGDLALRGWRNTSLRNYDLQNSILVASSGRGGSTWLGEVVSTLPGYVLLTEPLHVRHNEQIVPLGFEWETYIPPGANEPEKMQYLRDVVSGSNVSSRIVSIRQVKFTDFLKFQGFVVKFARANMLLGWLLSEMPLRTLLMIRHPCAVVLSQMRHKSWDGMTLETWTLPRGIAEDHPRLNEIFQRLATREELFAFCWAIQNYFALLHARDKVFFTTYERLLLEGRQEVGRIFEYLKLPVPPDAYRQLHEPSQTTRKVSTVASGKDPLTHWREALAPAQIDAILAVVHEVGVTCYADGPLPDYAALESASGATS